MRIWDPRVFLPVQSKESEQHNPKGVMFLLFFTVLSLASTQSSVHLTGKLEIVKSPEHGHPTSVSRGHGESGIMKQHYGCVQVQQAVQHSLQTWEMQKPKGMQRWGFISELAGC